MDSKALKKKNPNKNPSQFKQEMDYYMEQIKKLSTDDARTQLAFPPTLDNVQRKILHSYAQKCGLKSKSTGNDNNRFLTVYKKSAKLYIPTADNATTCLRLSSNTIEKLANLLVNDPVTLDEQQCSIHRLAESQSHAHLPFMFGDSRSRSRVTIPPISNNSEPFRSIRESLPIYAYRNEILTAINQNQIVVISGETGSGKTTQVPQFILEEYSYRNQECRIICTQPRRLAATSIAQRVSQERGDTLGRSVGYQIRLDSRVTPNTNLIFTTSGFLLRCLTGSKPEEVYKNLTHLVLDEVHEREKVTDFLLIAIKDAIQLNPHLKVILMSATLDSEQFSKYFNNCPVINVPGRLFDVDILYLGDVLMATGYKTKDMKSFMSENKAPKILRQQLAPDNLEDDQSDEHDNNKKTEQNAKIEISEDDIQFYDSCFDECMAGEDDSSFEQIFCLITDENMPVDYMHSIKSRTALSIAAEKGYDTVLTSLLGYGAKSDFKDAHGKTAFDYAEDNDHEECYQLLEQFAPIKSSITNDIVEDKIEAMAKALQQHTLLAYQMTNTQPLKWNEIDHELLQYVIHNIHTEKSTDGSILVFLPGYEDIMVQKEMIETRFQMKNYQLFVLHSGVNGTSSAEQAKVFDRMPTGIRKIILSTNIAETSLTINDVVYVIDAGKVKQLSYDSVSESTCLSSTNISQACAKQRAGRAGRIQNGFCYRLYSMEQYDTMEKYTLPEILRVPLTEICLNAKMLSGNLSIEAFLLKALQAPSLVNIRQSIQLLKKIDALDQNENITYLGVHLANMPVDCQLGKMILYSIMLRCLDPVVTIVSALSVKDPFMLPLGNEGDKINQIKRDFANDSMSDHYMLLSAFEKWSNKRTHQHTFCAENYISNGNMQMINGIRRLIMGHLKMAEFVAENSARNPRKLNENSLKWEIIKACLTAGMYPNVCRVTDLNGIFSKQDKKLIPHMSSILRDRKARRQIVRDVVNADVEWLIHGEKSRIHNLSLISHITVVPAIDIGLFSGPINLPESHLIDRNVDKVEIKSDMDCNDILGLDDIDDIDLDDELFAQIDDDINSDAILKIDEWISIIMDTSEANLLFQLRQKFASMFVKFLKNPVAFHMTNKEANMLKVLLETIAEEDLIENYIRRKKAIAARENEENEIAQNRQMFIPHSVLKNLRKPLPERQNVPAIMSTTYNQAIQPENRRNKRKINNSSKQNKSKKKLEKFTRSNHQMNQPSTSTEQSAVTNFDPQQMLTDGLFNVSLNDNMAAISQGVDDFVQNRYFVLTVKSVDLLYNSVYSQNWKFNTPLSQMKKAAREASPGKIILMWHIQKKSAIFGYGQFRTHGSSNYSIDVDKHMRNFRPLLSYDIKNDIELEPQQGLALYTTCLNMSRMNL